jgi:hypothetical protein
MHLRSGRSLHLPNAVNDSPPPKAVDVPKSSSSINTRDAFAAKFKSYAVEYSLAGNDNFISSITYFGIIFGLIHDNFSLVVSPGFDVSGRFKTSIIDRIQYWRKEIADKVLKHLLEDEVFDVENIRAAVAKTNAVVEAVGKQFETLGKA